MKTKEIIEFARDLPEWFTKEALVQIGKDLIENQCISEEIMGNLIGFLIYKIEGEKCIINWMGVKKEEQRKGIGKKLILELEEICKGKEVKFIEVDTLAETEDYEPYERTRKFYFSVGFKKFDFIPKGFDGKEDKLVLRKELK